MDAARALVSDSTLFNLAFTDITLIDLAHIDVTLQAQSTLVKMQSLNSHYFQLFNLPQSCAIDREVLSDDYRKQPGEVQPDRFFDLR